uniref:Uncharacterized protein n=1 Tax=Strongyloides venezuelensis TaxID=75913 RepID=A0A0K0F0M3_STRVS
MDSIRSVDHITFYKKVNYINKLILPLANKEQAEQSVGFTCIFSLYDFRQIWLNNSTNNKIPLILYFDDIRCNNILGSHKKNCKLC